MRTKKLYLPDENVNGINLVKRIDELLKKLGITRKEFCETIKIIPSTMATWKTRNILPPLETLCIIADYFDVSLDYLVRGHNFHNKNEHNIKNEIFSEIELFKKRIELYL